MAADLPPNPNSPATGAPINFHNPFEDHNPDEVWQAILAEPMKPISREEAMRRIVETAIKPPKPSA